MLTDRLFEGRRKRFCDDPPAYVATGGSQLGDVIDVEALESPGDPLIEPGRGEEVPERLRRRSESARNAHPFR